MELLELWQIQSASVSVEQNANSLVIIYAIVCYIIKRPVFLLAFLLPEIMFNTYYFDSMSEWKLNAIEFVIYSYVFQMCITKKSKIACFIICYTAIHFGIDSYYYGINGIYGVRETLIYSNIQYINSCAHLLLISTLVPISRIRDGLRNIINSIVCTAANSDYMFICWYNISKIQQSNMTHDRTATR